MNHVAEGIKNFLRPSRLKVVFTVAIMVLGFLSFAFAFACGETLDQLKSTELACNIFAGLTAVLDLGLWIGYLIDMHVFIPLEIEGLIYFVGNIPWAYLLACTTIALLKVLKKLLT